MLIIVIIFAVYLIWQRGNMLALIARYVYHNKNTQRGLNLYGTAYKIGGMSLINRINYAYMALKNGDVDICSMVLERYMDRAKKNNEKASAKSTYAIMLWKQGNIDGAINALQEVLSYGENSVAYGSLGFMYLLKKGNLRSAIEFCKKAYEYNPNDNIIADNYATALYKTGNLQQAEEIYKTLIDRRPTFPEVYYNYGHLLIDRGQITEGISLLKKALNSKFTFLTTLTQEQIEDEIEQYGQA